MEERNGLVERFTVLAHKTFGADKVRLGRVCDGYCATVLSDRTMCISISVQFPFIVLESAKLPSLDRKQRVCVCPLRILIL